MGGGTDFFFLFLFFFGELSFFFCLGGGLFLGVFFRAEDVLRRRFGFFSFFAFGVVFGFVFGFFALDARRRRGMTKK